MKLLFVMRYHLQLLLISIFLKSSSSKLEVAYLNKAPKEHFMIECATDKNPQEGVYMYMKKDKSIKPQEVFYYYKDRTLTCKATALKNKFNVSGEFPNLEVYFFDATDTDAGFYWCEFNCEEKTTLARVTYLNIVTEKNKTEEEELGKRMKNDCPEVPPNVKSFLIVCAVMSLLSIIGFIFVFLKMKGCWGNKKYKPSKHPDSVYEEMKGSNQNTQTTVP